MSEIRLQAVMTWPPAATPAAACTHTPRNPSTHVLEYDACMMMHFGQESVTDKIRMWMDSSMLLPAVVILFEALVETPGA